MRKKELIFFVIIFVTYASFIYGDNSIHKFLRIGSSGRTIGLGEAYVALSEDINVMNYNPSGIGYIKEKQFSLMHIELLDNMQYEYLAYAQYLGTIGTAGMNFRYFHYPEFESIDLEGNSQGKIGGADWALTTGWARNFQFFGFFKNNYAGINIKVIQSTLHDYSYTSTGLDIGIISDIYTRNRRQAFGIALRNFGINFKKPGKAKMPLPTELALGISQDFFKFKFHKVLGSVEIIFDRDLFNGFIKSSVKTHLGMEYSFRNFLFLRASQKMGYTTSQLSIGFGFHPDKLVRRYNLRLKPELDYAFVPYKDLGSTHYFSLTVKIPPNDSSLSMDESE